MNAREDILGRIRAGAKRGPGNEAAARGRVREWIAARRCGPRPGVGEDLAESFSRRAHALSSSVETVDVMAEVPAAVARYLQANGLPLVAVCAPQLADLPWAGAGVAVQARAARGEDLTGITGCFCAIADTGTLMLCSSPSSPASASLLPETHIAIVPVARIVACMEEGWALARSELGALPRAVNFVSGPSRTGDIEQTIVLGAHGPYRVHIVLVREDRGRP
ncbi:MAG: lactate utilization protein C [Rhodocyclaceae bacterium]